MTNTIYLIIKWFIFFIQSLLSLVIKKEDKVILFYKGNLTENHQLLIDYYLHNNPPIKLIVLYRNGYEDIFKQLTHYSSYSLSGFFQFIKSRYVIITHGEMDFKPYTKLKHQTIINIWHGIPLKNIDNPITTKKPIWDYIIVSSLYEQQLMMKANNVPIEKVLILGVPKNDILFQETSNIKRDKILYLNTFREKTYSKFFPFEDKNINSLNKFLKNSKLNISIKPHPNESNNPQLTELSKFSHIDIEKGSFELQKELKKSLCIITDYSGVLFDAVALNIPIFFIPYDYSEYSVTRGFYEDYFDFIPGPNVKTQKELISLLSMTIKGEINLDKHEVVKNKYFKYQDHNNSKRLFDFIINMKSI